MCIHSRYMYFYLHSENNLFLNSSCLKICFLYIQVSFNFLNFAILYQLTHVLTTESEMSNKQSFNSSLTVLIFFSTYQFFFKLGRIRSIWKNLKLLRKTKTYLLFFFFYKPFSQKNLTAQCVISWNRSQAKWDSETWQSFHQTIFNNKFHFPIRIG